MIRALLLILGGCAGCAAIAMPPADWAMLEGHKALAVVPGDPTTFGVAHTRTAELTASLAALAECEHRRQPDRPVCELIRLNDTTITTAAELRRRSPDPHPLYLWRYEAGPTTVWLAGSIHVLKRSLHPLPAPLEAAFANADTLVVEVDTMHRPADELGRELARVATLGGGATLSTVLPPALLERLTAELDRRGLPIAPFEPFNPAFVLTQLAVVQLLALGYDPAAGVDHHFLERAGERPVIELETPAEQFELLFGQPLADQVELLSDALDSNESVEPLLADLVAAWLAGDDAAFAGAFRAQTGTSAAASAFYRRLLDDRNVTMAAAIEDLFARPGSHFVLIGAAHFIGERGIIELLARRGIHGRRIASNEPGDPGRSGPTTGETTE